MFLSRNNKKGKIRQAPICIKRLSFTISLPLAIFEIIIKRPKKAEPVKAIHNNLLKPLKGDCDSFSNFFLIQDQFLTFIVSNIKLILYENNKILYLPNSSL